MRISRGNVTKVTVSGKEEPSIWMEFPRDVKLPVTYLLNRQSEYNEQIYIILEVRLNLLYVENVTAPHKHTRSLFYKKHFYKKHDAQNRQNLRNI